MNALLQSTKVDIIERQTFNAECIFDKFILKAIEAYEMGGSTKNKALSFIQNLTPLWALYEKDSYISIFKNFVDMEIGLEAITQSHASHINHVIQEFLFGYCVLMNCEYITKKYRFSEGKNSPDSEFGRLLFSWMAASLLHDVGYDIEEAPEEEDFRNMKNAFWSFMTHRAITLDPLSISVSGPGRQIINDILLKDINKLPGAQKISSEDFEILFLQPVKGKKGWVKYDHGVISAIKYISELQRLEKTTGNKFINWQPNRDAALAMTLHNFRYKKSDLHLKCTNKRSLIPYLLIVSDEIQEWERERLDIDSLLPDPSSGRNAIKKTELIGISFRNNRAFIIIDHQLKDTSYTMQFKDYLNKKFLLLKEHYPIKIFIPKLNQDIRKEVINSFTKKPIDYAIPIVFSVAANLIGVPLLPIISGSMVEITKDVVNSWGEKNNEVKKLQEIANTICQKELLNPSQPTPIYEIFVDHRIDGNPYLTVLFTL